MKKYEDITLAELRDEVEERRRDYIEAVKSYAPKSEVDFKKVLYEFFNTAYNMKYREVTYGRALI